MTTRGDRTRAKLIKATLSVVAEVGYAKTSTRAIATKAKVAEGTLYRHFPDKMSLFFAAAMTLLAALFGIGMMSAAHGGRIQRSDIVELVKMFVHGAAPRKGS
jgi:DNA-binding transcriptional regulator YbjK